MTRGRDAKFARRIVAYSRFGLDYLFKPGLTRCSSVSTGGQPLPDRQSARFVRDDDLEVPGARPVSAGSREQALYVRAVDRDTREPAVTRAVTTMARTGRQAPAG